MTVGVVTIEGTPESESKPAFQLSEQCTKLSNTLRRRKAAKPLNERLNEIFKDRLGDECIWLFSANEHLAGNTPAAMIYVGKYNEVLEALNAQYQ
jgi:hypothetical protein